MSLFKHYYLVCTQCSNQFVLPDGDHYGESGREIREFARIAGWVYIKVENGTMWDVCPGCQGNLRRKVFKQ